jgi:formylglycine-generating enzyme required for sulfatase activity
MPRHKVKVDKPFYLGQVPVTVGLWEAVEQGNLKSYAAAADPSTWLPKVEVSWEDAKAWVQELRRQIPKPQPGVDWHLPTEAEWELACRAGTLSEYWNGEDEAALAAVGWYNGNSENRIRSVTDFPTAEAKAHPYGLLHMQGLFWEWCEDPWDEQAYINKPPNDINVATSKQETPLRVVRGGSWRLSAEWCRSSFRGRSHPDDWLVNQGFRLCLYPRP